MMTRRLSRKIGAWLMVIAMVAGLVAVPAKEAEAAASEIELSFTAGSQTAAGDSKNHVEAVISVPSEYNTIDKLKNAGVTSLEVTFKITSAQTTGSLAAQAFINADGNWLSKWVEVGSASDNTITSTVDLTQLTSSGDVWNFGLQILNVSSVTYEITSAKLILAGSSSRATGGGTTDFGTSRDYSSGVSAVLSNSKDPTNDWSEFKVAITNNFGSTICDWIIVLQVPSGTASAFKCWSATFVADGDTIYMYPMKSGANAVIAQGALGAETPGGGFSGKYVDAGSIQVKAVYYNKGTSSEFDYSSGDTNDETGGTGGGGNSGSSATDTSTNKDLDVEYNYAKLLQESLYFYDANMCGNLEGTCGLSWRGNCHTYDKNVTTTINGVTYKVDVSGGFHDAGDHVKFGLPQGYAATMLGMSYYQFPDAYTSTGQTAHLQAITDYFCDYFKRCTVYDSSGKVVGFCYQVGDGNTDHGIWSAPEGQTMSRPAYFATASNPATDEVSVAIAALAMNYINFRNEEDLKTAEDLFTFVKNNSKACATNGASGFYDSTSYGDDYALAASALYVATKNTSYNSIYNEYKDNSGNGVNQYWVLDWANTGALACMLQKDTSKLAGITNAGKNCSTIDGFFNCVSDWGSCRYNSASGFVGLVYDKLTNTTTYDSWVVSQMNYMIGDNPNKRCYIVGYNENSSQYPHHRAASRSTDAKVTREDHYTLLGALVGGPGKDGTYKDDQNDYHCNEVALDYNAGLVSALAGLYCTHKNDTSTYLSYAKKTTTNYSTTLASADELSAVGVTKYYGSSSGVSVESVTLDNEELTLYVGDTDTLTATVTPSGAATVTWKSSDSRVATVSNGKVTAVKEGTATITATAGGKSAACKVTVTAAPVAKLEAGPAGLTCTALEYGYTNPAAGLVNISNNGTAEASGVTAALESGSSFTITQMPSESISVGGKAAVGVTPKNGLSAGTYKDTLKVTYNSSLTLSVPVTLTVNKRAVTVTADNVFKTYGEENPALTYKVTSGAVVSGDSLNITCSTTASKTSDAGSYPVTVTLGSNPNYEITTQAGILTVVADTYTIDVSKLSNANYVDALCTSSGMATVSYDTGTGVLTLTDSSKPYTITGSNSNVTVKTVAGSGQSITLNNTTIQNLDVTNNAVVTITGTAKVTGSIIADNTSVTLRGSETLNVETIKADNGTVNIEGGTVNAGTVTAKNINISGGTIMITGTITAANDVTITGGTVIAKGGISAENKVVISGNKTNVTATGSDGNPAISASDITITDASVTATGGNGASAISSTGSITMKNANVTADTTGDGSAPAIRAGEGDEYKITIDGGNVTGNSVDNMYSKNPVDSQGNIIATYKVSIMDEAANRNETKAINAGSSVTLQAAGKKGYKAGWKDQNGKTYADGAVVTIEDDCSFTAVYTKISVTSVKLSVPAVELEVGKTVTATVKVLPADAADTSVTWSSSNPAVAAVDSKGVITAKAKGTAVITVTSNDTKVSDSVTITVKEASKPEQGSTEETDVKASSILLKASVKGAASVPVKSTYKLAPKKSMTLKVSFAPENAVEEKVTFKSSNTKIVKVNSKGKITAGKKAGKATITVTSENGLKKTFKVQVMKKAVTKVKIKASKKTVKVKKTLQLKAITSPGKKNASNSVYWKSSNPKIATVSSTGKVKAIKKGKVKITAVATDGSGKKTTITIKVKK